MWVTGVMAPTLQWNISPRDVPVEVKTPDRGLPQPESNTNARSGESVAQMPVDFPLPPSKAKAPETPLPSPDNAAKPPSEELAPLNPQYNPSIPETTGVYREAPGGDTLVVLLTIDDTYTVVNSEIKVGSFNPMANMGIAVGAIGQKFLDVYPPIEHGELRKVDYRVRFDDPYERAKRDVENLKRREQGLPPAKVFIPPEQMLP